AEPGVFADALMNHVLVEVAASRVGGVGTDGEVRVGEHAPGADDFDTLGGVSFDQEVVSHGVQSYFRRRNCLRTKPVATISNYVYTPRFSGYVGGACRQAVRSSFGFQNTLARARTIRRCSAARGTQIQSHVLRHPDRAAARSAGRV